MFREGDSLPAGMRAHFLASAWPEVAYYLSPPRALVVADALWGAPDGTIWLGGDEFRPPFRRLLDTLPINVLVLSHGVPVLKRAHEAIAQVLQKPLWRDSQASGVPQSHSPSQRFPD